MTQAFYHHTWEAEAGDSELEASLVYIGFQASQGYIVIPCFKTNQTYFRVKVKLEKNK